MRKTLLVSFIGLFLFQAVYSQFPDDEISLKLKRSYMEPGAVDFFSLMQVILGDCRADNALTGGDFPGEIPAYDEFMLFSPSPENSYTFNYWFRGYTIVSNCNLIIESVAGSELETAVQERYAAEARFLRALTMFTLTNTFGAVPYPTDSFSWELVYDDNFSLLNKVPGPVLSMAEVYSQLETDITEALNYLPDRASLNSEEYFRATTGAAHALLGKVLLYASSFAANYPSDQRFNGFSERWNDALSHLEMVINSGEYALFSEETETWWRTAPELTPPYRALFSTSQNGGTEMVFSIHNADIEGGYTSYRTFAHTNYSSVRYYTNELDQTYNTTYWGFVLPTADLINAFADVAGIANDDPRFAVTVGVDGDSVACRGTNGVWRPLAFVNGFETCTRKWECSADEFNGTWYDTPLDFPVIRFADVILMAAEASLNTGDDVAALDYLNMVRKRARLSGNTGKPENLSAISMDTILLERRVELAEEGHRFFDLLRLGKAYEVLDQKYIEVYDETATFIEGEDEFLSYPDTLIGTGSTELAILDEQANEISIYPNPGNGNIEITGLTGYEYILINDIQGREVKRIVPGLINNRLDLTFLNPGVYFISITNGEQQVVHRYIKK